MAIERTAEDVKQTSDFLQKQADIQGEAILSDEARDIMQQAYWTKNAAGRCREVGNQPAHDRLRAAWEILHKLALDLGAKEPQTLFMREASPSHS